MLGSISLQGQAIDVHQYDPLRHFHSELPIRLQDFDAEVATWIMLNEKLLQLLRKSGNGSIRLILIAIQELTVVPARVTSSSQGTSVTL